MDEAPRGSEPGSNNGVASVRTTDAHRADVVGSERASRTSWPVDFASIVELFPDPFILLCPIHDQGHQVVDFEFCDANKAARDYLMRTHDEILGLSLLELFPRLVGSPLLTHLTRSLETGEPTVLSDVAIDIAVALRDAVNPSRYYDIHGVRVDGGVMLTWYEVTGQHELIAQYRVLAENASDVVVQLDLDGVVRWIAPSVFDGLGWSPEELVGKELAELFDDASLESWRQRLSEVATRRSESFGVAIRAKPGEYHHYSLTTRPVADEHGTLDAIAGSMRCIDAEVEARQALRAAQDRYQLLVENSSDVVVLGNTDRKIEWISESVSNLLGWHPSQMQGRPYTDYVHPDDLERVLAMYSVLGNGQVEEYAVRLRTLSGGYRWVAVTVHEVAVPDGGLARIAAWRDAESEVLARVALEDSEAQFRMLAENASDVVYQTDPEGIIRWVSPSIAKVLGWRPEDLLGRPDSALIAEEDLDLAASSRSALEGGDSLEPYEVRYRTREGNVRWMSMHPQAVRDGAGVVMSLVVSLRDHQSVVTLRRAANTLAAGNRLLLRAANEDDLLSEMCQIVVDQGGYVFAWYARRVYDATHSVLKTAMSRAHSDYLDAIEVSWADNPYGQGPLGRALRTGLAQVAGDFATDSSYSPWVQQTQAHGFRSSIALPVRVDGEVDGVLSVYAAEPYAFEDGAIEVLEDLGVEVGHGLKRLRDHDRLVKSMYEQTLLASVINEAGESVVVTDPSSMIIYANPAALRTSGFELEEVLGQNPRIFRGTLGQEQLAVLEELRTQLRDGETWRGILKSQRKSGEVYEEEVTISPIHDEDHVLTAYVSVKRDLTTERRLEADLTREVRTRGDIVDLMKRVQAGESANETVERFCRALMKLESVDAAAVLLLQRKGELVRIGIHSSAHLSDVEAGYDLFNVPAWMLERTAVGPWWQLAREWRSEMASFFESVLGVGIVASAVVPVFFQGEMVAVLTVGTKDATAGTWMGSRLASLEEMGTYAGTLFGWQAKDHQQRVQSRTRLRTIIDEQRFAPVFQPFVNLQSRRVVGYEALTRFEDEVRPDLRFIEAHGVGLGSELEAVCARAALESARNLPAESWLSVNFSPATLLDGRGAGALEGGRRPLVIEVTEHAPIKNYAAVRRAVREIGGCRLAVDDAGAGFTSLSHILELQPEFVKLDISLVRDIDSDPTRQAMTAGMCHFAAQTGTVVVAEGIETESEAQMLLKIGVPLAGSDLLGQGYLFGRPGPLP